MLFSVRVMNVIKNRVKRTFRDVLHLEQGTSAAEFKDLGTLNWNQPIREKITSKLNGINKWLKFQIEETVKYRNVGYHLQ